MRKQICAKILAAVLACTALNACDTIANYDVPKDVDGDPTVASIVQRVNCELASLVDGSYLYENFLLLYDVNVAINLSLTVNNKGGISPTFTYLDGPFTFTGGFTLRKEREQNAFQQLRFSMRKIALEVERAPKAFRCPPADTHLAGELGIRQTVSSAIKTPDLNLSPALSPTLGAFGGVMSVVLTKSLDGIGPNFSLISFRGPGGFANLSEVNTDKLFYAFAPGPNAGKPFVRNARTPIPTNGDAEKFLSQILLNDISTQLTGIKTLSRL